MTLIAVLALKRKSLVLALVKQKQNSPWVSIIIVIVVTYSLIGKHL